MLVHDNEPISVSIQGQADIRALFPNPGRHHFRMQGAAVVVDVEPIGLVAQSNDRGSQFLKISGATR